MSDIALPPDLAVPPKRNGTTFAIEIYKRLREDIINAVLEPGKKLRIRDICTHYSTGLSPVREALSRLSSEGLVDQSAQRGFTVANFSVAELEELIRTRRWLDEQGLRESLRLGDQAWEENVVLSYYRLSRTPRYTEQGGTVRNPAWYEAHKNFHLSLLDACGSQWLKRFSLTLFDAMERYRALSRTPGVLLRSSHLDEHRAIMEASVARDTELAVKLMADHFQRTGELVHEKLSKRANVETSGIRRVMSD